MIDFTIAMIVLAACFLFAALVPDWADRRKRRERPAAPTRSEWDSAVEACAARLEYIAKSEIANGGDEDSAAEWRCAARACRKLLGKRNNHVSLS
jgi:hypothetical protein